MDVDFCGFDDEKAVTNNIGILLPFLQRALKESSSLLTRFAVLMTGQVLGQDWSSTVALGMSFDHFESSKNCKFQISSKNKRSISVNSVKKKNWLTTHMFLKKLIIQVIDLLMFIVFSADFIRFFFSKNIHQNLFIF